MSASESDFPHPPLRMRHLPCFPHRCRPAGSGLHFLQPWTLFSALHFLTLLCRLSGCCSRQNLCCPAVFPFLLILFFLSRCLVPQIQSLLSRCLFLQIQSLLSRCPFLMAPRCLSGFLSRSALYFPSVLRFRHLPLHPQSLSRYPEWIRPLLLPIWSAFPCLLLPLPVPMPVSSVPCRLPFRPLPYASSSLSFYVLSFSSILSCL